jgi:hypothetical protein
MTLTLRDIPGAEPIAHPGPGWETDYTDAKGQLWRNAYDYISGHLDSGQWFRLPMIEIEGEVYNQRHEGAIRRGIDGRRRELTLGMSIT